MRLQQGVYTPGKIRSAMTPFRQVLLRLGASFVLLGLGFKGLRALA